MLSSTFLFDSGKYLEVAVRHWCTNEEHGVGVGNIFYGSEGYMTIHGYSKYATYLGQKREPGPTRDESGDHYANFVEVVRSRDMSLLHGPVETAHYSSAIAHLATSPTALAVVWSLTRRPRSSWVTRKQIACLLATIVRPSWCQTKCSRGKRRLRV